MTIDELRKECGCSDCVLLYLPAPNGQGYSRHLCGRCGPLGKIVCGTDKGQVVRFGSAAILRFLNTLEDETQFVTIDQEAAKAAGGDDG